MADEEEKLELTADKQSIEELSNDDLAFMASTTSTIVRDPFLRYVLDVNHLMIGDLLSECARRLKDH